MKELSEETNWNEILRLDRNTNIDEVAERFYTHINGMISECIPLRKNNKNSQYKEPWLNKLTLRAVRRKYFAWKRYQDSKSYNLYQKYLKERNKTTKNIRKAKREYEKRLAKEKLLFS